MKEKNSKPEIPARSQAGGRNSKQIQMLQKQKAQNEPDSEWRFDISKILGLFGC